MHSFTKMDCARTVFLIMALKFKHLYAILTLSIEPETVTIGSLEPTLTRMSCMANTTSVSVLRMKITHGCETVAILSSPNQEQNTSTRNAVFNHGGNLANGQLWVDFTTSMLTYAEAGNYTCEIEYQQNYNNNNTATTAFLTLKEKTCETYNAYDELVVLIVLTTVTGVCLVLCIVIILIQRKQLQQRRPLQKEADSATTNANETATVTHINHGFMNELDTRSESHVYHDCIIGGPSPQGDYETLREDRGLQLYETPNTNGQ